MKIVVIAPGSRGDVQPYIALGCGLRDAGHHVVVQTNADFRPLVESYGLAMVAVSEETHAQVQAHMQSIVEGGNLYTILRETGRGAARMARQTAAASLDSARDADLLLGGFGGLVVGAALSDALDIPFVQAYLMPFTPTRAFPGVLTPIPPALARGWVNRASHYFARQAMWQTLRPADRAARRDVLQLPQTSFWGPFASLAQQRQPVLYGYSPSVIPAPADWDALHHVTGYWFLDPPSGWEPPQDVVSFLDSGAPPVYIGFGSMPSRDPVALMKLVVEAVSLAGVRAIVDAGWAGLSSDSLPPHMLLVRGLPHAWLFPRTLAVVHHGGAGTTGAGLRAGVPSIIAPFFGDQPFWGRRVAELGVGPHPIARRHLTAERLASAITEAVERTAMRESAMLLGQQIRAEDGVRAAVAALRPS